MKRLLALILAFSVNAYGAAVVPNIFATQPSGNVPASYLDTDFALISDYNTFSNYLVDTGAANAYVVTFPAGTTGSLAAGLLINFKAGADNTGASTLAVNGMTAKNITNYDASALAAGQIKAGAIVSVIYDGTQFKLAGQPGGVSPSFLTPQATNTVLGNATSGTASPTALAVGGCSSASSALIWTTNTGFGCNTSITANTAGTVTTAAQPSITSVGTLTGLTMGGNVGLGANYLSYGGTAAGLSFDASNNATFSGSLTAGAISGTTGGFSGNVTLTQAAGSNIAVTLNQSGVASWIMYNFATSGHFQIQQGGNGWLDITPTTGGISIPGPVGIGGASVPASGLAVTGTTSSTAFSGPLTGNVTGNVSGTAATVTGAAQSAITSVGTLTGLSSSSYKDGAGNLIISSTAPTIASGFGTSPSIVANNTAAFYVNVGTGGTATNGVITMPTAPTGWACGAVDRTNVAIADTVAVYNGATSIILQNYHRTTGTAIAWTASDIIDVHCTAF